MISLWALKNPMVILREPTQEIRMLLLPLCLYAKWLHITKCRVKTLAEVMDALYSGIRLLLQHRKSYEFEGAAGMDKMQNIMDTLRENPPEELNGMAVTYVGDYKTSIARDIENGTETRIDLPKSNVLAYKMAGGNGLIIRPSGTEPKNQSIYNCNR